MEYTKGSIGRIFLLKFKDDDGRGRNENDAMFGIRFPLGITYLFEDAPLDLFFELVPVLDLSPDVDLDMSLRPVKFRDFVGQNKVREAVESLEKFLQLAPGHEKAGIYGKIFR